MNKNIIKKILVVFLIFVLSITTFASQHESDLVTGIPLYADRHKFEVRFGKYPSSGMNMLDKEYIKWYICSKDEANGIALLVSEYVIDVCPYNNTNDACTWETSYIRQWLNTTFYNNAFSEEDKRYIIQAPIETNGVITNDNVFLLSENELQSYFTLTKTTGDNCFKRMYTTVTNYANRNEKIHDFWTRGNSIAMNKKNCVMAYLLSERGCCTIKNHQIATLGVRPAIYVMYDVNAKSRFQQEMIDKPLDMFAGVVSGVQEKVNELPDVAKNIISKSVGNSNSKSDKSDKSSNTIGKKIGNMVGDAIDNNINKIGGGIGKAIKGIFN